MLRRLAVVLSTTLLPFSGPRDACAADPAPVSTGQEPAGISTGHYVGAGLAGTLLGYGIGHAIAGEWSKFGWICTAGEITPLFVGAVTLSFSRLNNGGPDDDALPIGLLVGYGVFRVIEIID